MSAQLWVAIALGVIVLAGSVRLIRAAHAGSVTGRGGARLAALLVLQALSGVLLYFTLLPPQRPAEAGALVVLAAGASQAGALPVAGTVIALPEAEAPAGAERAPDLATALRRHAGSGALLLVGDGLSARDRDAPLPARVNRQLPPAPRGWIAMQPPGIAAPGAVFPVTARADGVPNARAELLDPAGVVVDRASVDARGTVRLHGTARAAGRSTFTLRLLDDQQHTVDSLPIPQQTIATPAPRVLILAGAPGPELKYLRRWATDTGLAVQAQASAGGGVMLGDAPVALTAERLAATDVLVLDERSLATLGATQRALIQRALRDGLGVVVRSSGPLGDAARQMLRAWGLPVTGGTRAAPLQLTPDPDAALLQARRGPQPPAGESTTFIYEADAASHSAAAPTLERFEMTLPGIDALLHDAKGAAVGGWGSVGRGRLAVLPITDSYSLVLAGRDDRYAELWSGVLARVARALPGVPAARLQTVTPWSGERVVWCDVAAKAQVRDPSGNTVALHIDPATGSQHCAGYWPQQPGWHQLQQDETVQAFYVFDPTSAQPLHRQQLREVTAQRLRELATAPLGASNKVPGPRWPWLLAFIAVVALLWLLERRLTTPAALTQRVFRANQD